jgi:hypothetical protein
LFYPVFGSSAMSPDASSCHLVAAGLGVKSGSRPVAGSLGVGSIQAGSHGSGTDATARPATPPEQRKDGARGDAQIDAPEYSVVAIGLGEPGDLDGWCHGHGASLQPMTLRQGQARVSGGSGTCAHAQLWCDRMSEQSRLCVRDSLGLMSA